MRTAAYNIKHNNVYECRYRQKAFSMWLTIHIQFLRGQVNSYEHCLLHYEVVRIRTSLATQDLNATKIPQTLPPYTCTESVWENCFGLFNHFWTVFHAFEVDFNYLSWYIAILNWPLSSDPIPSILNWSWFFPGTFDFIPKSPSLWLECEWIWN